MCVSSRLFTSTVSYLDVDQIRQALAWPGSLAGPDRPPCQWPCGCFSVCVRAWYRGNSPLLA